MSQLEFVDCPIETCERERLKGSRGLGLHFSKSHQEFPKEVRPKASDKSVLKDGVECPVCYSDCSGQHRLNKHFKQAHQEILNKKKPQKEHTEFTRDSQAGNQNSDPPKKESALEFVNCPIETCERKDLKGSRGLNLHFTKSHQEFPNECRPTDCGVCVLKNRVECPVCHTECSGQQGLNQHFNERHLRTKLKRSASGKGGANYQHEDVYSAQESVLEYINCPVWDCDKENLNGSLGLAVHFRKTHPDFPNEDPPKTCVNVTLKKNSVACPVCHIKYSGQQGLNKHFNHAHQQENHKKSTQKQSRYRAGDGKADNPPGKASEKKCVLEFVNCPMETCERENLKGSRGLALHFRNNHPEFPNECRPEPSDNTVKDGVQCPVCHVEYSGQQGLNRHFYVKHRQIGLVTKSSTHANAKPDCIKESKQSASPRERGKFTTKGHSEKEDDLQSTMIKGSTEVRYTVNAELIQRCKDLRPNITESREVSKQMNEIRTAIVDALEETADDRYIAWKKPKGTGSSYEKLKIGDPDEYDTIYTCDINCYCEYLSEGYCHLRVRDRHNVPPEILTGKDYICPKAFMTMFRKIVDEAKVKISRIQKKYSIRRLKVTHSDYVPAVTLTLDDSNIDLVPAICVPGWPPSCDDWKASWVRSCTTKDELMDGHHAVAKIHHTELEKPVGQCKKWFLSFSCLEKKLLYHADGTFSRSSFVTCRKQLIMLLKSDLNDLNIKRRRECKYFTSYCMKTTALNLFQHRAKSSYWVDDHLVNRYYDALTLLIDCLRKEELYHFVLKKNNNLLGEMKRPANEKVRTDSQAEKDALIKHFEEKRQVLNARLSG